VIIAIKVIKNNPSFKAAVSIICFAKNPTNGGIPAKENRVIDKLIPIKGFILKYPFNCQIN
jgi:hypothetical protein